MRPSPLRCLAASLLLLCGCSSSDVNITPLSAFVGQPLHGWVSSDGFGNVYTGLELTLPGHDDARDGCLQLSEKVEARFNGVPVPFFDRGGGFTHGGCITVNARASYVDARTPPLPQERAFPVGTRDGVLELREGETVLRMEVRDLFVPLHGPVWDGAPLRLRGGEQVFVAWSPATTDLSEIVPRATLQEGFPQGGYPQLGLLAPSLPVRREAGGFWLGPPVGMAPGLYYVVFSGKGRRQVTGCAGPSVCEMVEQGPWYNRQYPGSNVKIPVQLEVLP